MYGAVSDSTGNKTDPSAIFSHDHHSEPQSRNLQDGLSAAFAGTVSSSGAANLDYANYATPTATARYPNNDSYGYRNIGYADYNKQWTNYYSQTEVTCAPGTKNVYYTSAPNLVSPVPVVDNAYSAPNSQQVASTALVPSSWKPESGLFELPSVQGPIVMAAHQICLQVWLFVSLIIDALAASGQALIASSVSKGDYRSVKDITYFMLTEMLLPPLFTNILSFVEDNRKTKWCCDYVVDFNVGGGTFDVTCGCSYSFCWNLIQNHVSNASDQLKRTKAVCILHVLRLANLNSARGFYACNRYEAAKQEGVYDDTEKRREMAKNSLERYTHYYER
ncbi:unnamed protein product [Lactuca virosa]|uniref:Uncharacterized protein n=1 Tax=Lactuca virosa TaxID=75947 RepID=A0AAU9MGP6_9ASTR|nr:unnamed protein product [Lactuca virosa]